WLTWWNARGAGASIARHVGYFLAWPGMDAEAFLGTRRGIQKPERREWAVALLKTGVGTFTVFSAAQLDPTVDSAACWIRIAGVVLFLHLGAFHLVSCLWRGAGIDAQPIMNRPLAATSVSDFWARRWNTAYHDLAHRYIFVPLSRWFGAALAMVIAFTVSWLVHELVSTVPARCA